MFNLRTLFIVVFLVELFYGAAGLLVPPSLVGPWLGWNLTADGQWLAKLLGCALSTQALTAWVLRKDPPPAMGYVLGAYQLAAAATDVILLYALAEAGIFADSLARVSVYAAIPTHAALGVLLMLAARRATPEVA